MPPAHSRLTRAERAARNARIVRMVAAGLTGRQIADRLGMTPSAVLRIARDASRAKEAA